MAKQLTRFNFTVNSLSAVTCEPSGRDDGDGRVYVYDTRVPGLAFCVTEGGVRNFYFCRRVGGRYQRMKLGTPAEWTVERARHRAGEINSAIARGENPQAEKVAKREAATLADLWQSYLDSHAKQHKKPRSIAEDTRLYESHVKPWAGNRLISEIASTDVDLLKTRIGATSTTTANRVLALLSCMYRKRGKFFGLAALYTPTAGVDRYRENARDRLLSPDELSRFLAALAAEPNETLRDFFFIALYTGARRSNVAAMKWEDINLQRCTWRIPGEIYKNGQPLVIQLAPEAVALLEKRADDSPYVFAAKRFTSEQHARATALASEGMTTRGIAREVGISQSTAMRMLAPGFVAGEVKPIVGVTRAMKRILAAAGIVPRTTLHDLRRTFCTAMLEAGVPMPHVSAAMGHKTMTTTQKHYAIARQEKVREGVVAGVAGMLAAAAEAGEEAAAKKRAG
jgi:integrase